MKQIIVVMGTLKGVNILILCTTGLWNSLPYEIIEIQNLTVFKTTQTFISVTRLPCFGIENTKRGWKRKKIGA